VKVLAVTGTRADWGLLCPVLRLLKQTDKITLKIAATGQHITNNMKSHDVFIADGFVPDHFVDMGLTDDDAPHVIAAAMGRGLSGMAEVINIDRPDIMLVLGDRYEILAAVSAALLLRVPVAHIAGGDVTEGAFDDSIRHAITKMSALHFVTNDLARKRVLQMGEVPQRVFNTGSPGVDAILGVKRLTRAQLLEGVGLPSEDRRLFLVTFHPETLLADSLPNCRQMLRALENFPESHVIFTGSNADPQARKIDDLVKDWVKNHYNSVFHQSLGTKRYVSAIAEADVVIGNSSSGLYEAPSFSTPTVNIGDRQAGRVRAESIIDSAPNSEDITLAINLALRWDKKNEIKNPYGDGNSALRIASILTDISEPKVLVRKSFNGDCK
jgi:UDP-hydrolysing UDP-N-acetyl-D-glucosamine 2-epimerase